MQELIREPKILPLASQYLLSSMLFVINNKNQFMTNSEKYNTNTRQLNNMHLPRPNLSKYLKGTLYLGIKVYNNLHSCIKDKNDNPKKFQNQLKKHFTFTLFLFFRILSIIYLKFLRFTQSAISVYQFIELFKLYVYKHLFFM